MSQTGEDLIFAVEYVRDNVIAHHLGILKPQTIFILNVL